jgi:hypothetical protein
MKSLGQQPVFCQVFSKSGDDAGVFTSGDVLCGKSSLSEIKGCVIGTGYRCFTEAILREQ